MDAFRAFLEQWLAATQTSQAQLSRQSGIPQNVISRWLGTAPTRPSDANLRKLAPLVGRSHEDLMRLCGRLSADGSAGHVQTELELRLGRLAERLTKYPRAFWLPVLDAWERMADAGDALDYRPEPLPPVSASVQGRVSAATRAPKRGARGSGGTLAKSYPALLQLPPIRPAVAVFSH